MKIRIRKADENDMPEVLDLIRELAHFEREPDAVEVTVEELTADGFSNRPAFKCFVAELDGKIEGMALIYMRYSTWKGKALHLEDLIVKQSSRGKGIGGKLLDKVILHAEELGVKRVSWEVLDWNTHAIDFYERKGAKVLRDWDVVQLDAEGIKNYISNLK